MEIIPLGNIDNLSPIAIAIGQIKIAVKIGNPNLEETIRTADVAFQDRHLFIDWDAAGKNFIARGNPFKINIILFVAAADDFS